jgi:1-acyl-sn-glycerol-3-phosphate acyltransferase
VAPKSLSLAVGTVHAVALPLIRRVRGVERLRRAEPCIVVANHSSFLDGPVLETEFVWRLGRPFHMIAYEEPFRHPLLGWFLRSGRVIPFGRGTRESRIRVLRIAKEVMDAGESVGIFPEAHLNARDALRRPRPGAALLALWTGRPVVPAGIRGTDGILPPEGPFRPRRRIEIDVGEPLDFSREARAYARADADGRAALVRAVLARMMAAIAPLAGKRLPLRDRG